MLFNSYIFFIFLSVVLCVFYALKNTTWKKYWLLVASLFFYGYWDWHWLGLFGFSIVFNYFLGFKIADSKTSSKKWLAFGVTINLSIIVLFKYFNFFIDSLSVFGRPLDFLHLHFILPIGISFYTFQAIAYLVDIYRKEIKPVSNFIDFGLYKSFFPLLIAGPIERASHLIPQFSSRLIPTKEQVKEGFFLITIGLFQKVMIGDACGRIVDTIFFDLNKYASFEIVSAVLLFTFQIYADFAGYSNIARGLAKLMGIDLMVNFNKPYWASNIQEFWQKWHISLSTWLRDYLYIPLGGNQKGTNRTLINLMLVMLLGGLWHGAGWNYLLWGFYHGLLLVIYRRTQIVSLPKFISIALTFILVVTGWAIFRLTSVAQFELFFEQMQLWSWGDFPLRFIKMMITFGSVLFFIDWLQIKYQSDAFLLKFKNQAFAYGISCSLLLVSFLYILTKKPLPFIYFQF